MNTESPSLSELLNNQTRRPGYAHHSTAKPIMAIKDYMPLVLATLAAVCGGTYYFLGRRNATQTSLSRNDVVLEMQNRASQAVNDAKIEYGIMLDYSPDSIELVEEILGQLHQKHAAQPFSAHQMNLLRLKWGGYVGEVIKRLHNAEWELDSQVGGPGSLPIVYSASGESFPIMWTHKRIANGEEDNVWHKFNVLVINRENNDDGVADL